MSTGNTARPARSRRALLGLALLFTALALANSWAFASAAGGAEGVAIPAAAWIDFALGAVMAAASAWYWRAWLLARRGQDGGQLPRE